jgi:2-C-methyl-D-erythritol 2,4-cyclodiphosphate synthase
MLRVGQGYDIHPLVEGRPLLLGGEEIPFDRGLQGHSDGDVLLHALGDAILGASGLGDLGDYFPPGDPQWKDADSLELLRRIVSLSSGKGFKTVNADLCVIAEVPKLAPYRESIRSRIAAALSISIDAVGLKATTNERLGAIGREEGIAALAVVLLEKG